MPIKQEPGLQPNQMPSYQGFTGIENKNSAAYRAAQQLQAQYGQRAQNSINAIHQQQQQPQAQQQQTPAPQGQQQHQQGQPMNQQQQHLYRQQMAAATAQQQQQQQQRVIPNGQPPHIQNGQTDGAADQDFEGILMQRSAEGTLHELGRVEIDSMLHAQIAAKAKSMEGGGLMLPLKEATKQPAASSSRSKGKQPAAYDGGDDDDDDIDDEDAINSDLDDSDEDRDDDEVDDEGLGHIMLCMYDKVQRVKNKW